MNLPKHTLKFFEFQAKNYFGLSIKDTSLAIVQSSESNHHLKTFSYLNLPPGVVQNGEIKNSQSFINALKKIIDAAQIKTPFVVCSVPETQVFSKILEIPNLSNEELEEAISWQAEDQIPIEKSKIYFDFKILEKNNNKIKAYLVAVPRKTVDHLTLNLQKAGLVPVAIESSALALTRFISPKIQNPVLIIETETPSTILSVAYKNTVLISNSFDTPQKNSAQLERDLTREISRLKEFCLKKLKIDFNSILFFGDLPIKINPKTLTTLNLKNISPFLNLKAPPPQFLNRFQSLALAFSLSQKKATSPSDVNSVNLLPPNLQGIYDLKEKQQFLSKTCFSFTLFLIIVTASLALTFTFLTINLKRLESEIKTRLTQSPNGETLLVEKSAKDLNLRSNQIIALSVKISQSSNDLITLKELVPYQLNISSLNLDYDQNRLSLSGLAPKREDVIKLKEDLEKSKIFINPQIPLKSLEKKENVEFIINFQKPIQP